MRFYIENTIDFEEFNLFTLTIDDFAVLWICLAYENISKDFTVTTDDGINKGFKPLAINNTLAHFDKLEFAQFLTELKKQKITLSLKQQDEWDRYFADYKKECNLLSVQISATDKEIDKMVYALYGLSEEEVKLIEK